MTIHSLRDLNLHDSELMEITVDRVDRVADQITLRLNYVEDYVEMRTAVRRLVFSGCVKTILDMNFKVATPDSILSGGEIEPSPMLDAARMTWANIGLPLAQSVRHFRIETATTGSIVTILAEKVELLDAT